MPPLHWSPSVHRPTGRCPCEACVKVRAALRCLLRECSESPLPAELACEGEDRLNAASVCFLAMCNTYMVPLLSDARAMLALPVRRGAACRALRDNASLHIDDVRRDVEPDCPAYTHKQFAFFAATLHVETLNALRAPLRRFFKGLVRACTASGNRFLVPVDRSTPDSVMPPVSAVLLCDVTLSYWNWLSRRALRSYACLRCNWSGAVKRCGHCRVAGQKSDWTRHRNDECAVTYCRAFADDDNHHGNHDNHHHNGATASDDKAAAAAAAAVVNRKYDLLVRDGLYGVLEIKANAADWKARIRNTVHAGVHAYLHNDIPCVDFDMF